MFQRGFGRDAAPAGKGRLSAESPETTRDRRVGQRLGRAAKANLRSPGAEGTEAAQPHAVLRAAATAAAGAAGAQASRRERPPACEGPRSRRQHPPPSSTGHPAPADASPARPPDPRSAPRGRRSRSADPARPPRPHRPFENGARSGGRFRPVTSATGHAPAAAAGPANRRLRRPPRPFPRDRQPPR